MRFTFEKVKVRRDTETDMAQRGALFCPLCLNLLEEPVATPCGHNYCRKCLKAFWDERQECSVYSSPCCMKPFASRTLPTANADLAVGVEELKNTGTSADKAEGGSCTGQGDLTEAGPGDVACDVCTGRKRKALQSCLDCLASYCELHLQPHQDAAPLKKHQLVHPPKRQRLKTCPLHEDEDLDMFCRTDQQSICHLCSTDEHSEHDVVSVTEERDEKQKELQGRQEAIQHEVKEREELLEKLLQEMDTVTQSADKAVQKSGEVFGQLIALLEMRREELSQEVRSRQEKEVSDIQELREKLQRDIAELKKRADMLRWISDTADPKHFLDQFSSLVSLDTCTKTPDVQLRPSQHFSAVTEALSALTTEDVFGEKWENLKWTAMNPDMLLSKPQPKARDDFLKFFCDVTLDPDTSYRHLLISDGGKKAERIRGSCYERRNPERFLSWDQVLSTEAMTGKCYWEVKWVMDTNHIYIAVAYGDMKRNNSNSAFGSNDKSWALYCCRGKHMELRHNGTVTTIPKYPCKVIGVYLDHSAGLLSFHDAFGSMNLLHRVLTTFTQPLHAGFFVGYKNSVTLL